MIYCVDNYTAIQLKLWQAKAKKALTDCNHIRNAVFTNLAYGGDADLKAAREKLRNAEKNAVWASNFLGILDDWQYLPNDTHYIIRLHAVNLTPLAKTSNQPRLLTNEFNFAVFGRNVEDYDLFDRDSDRKVLINPEEIEVRQAPFLYNGGLINHGTEEFPNWNRHT